MQLIDGAFRLSKKLIRTARASVLKEQQEEGNSFLFPGLLENLPEVKDTCKTFDSEPLFACIIPSKIRVVI